MIELTSEDVSVLYGFEAILSGLLVFVLAWAFYRSTGRPDWRSRLRRLSLALLSLSIGFLCSAALNFYEFYYQEQALDAHPENIGFFFFLLFALMLAGAFVPAANWKRVSSLIWIGAAGVGGAVGILALAQWSSGGIQWLVLALLFPALAYSSQREQTSAKKTRFLGLALFGFGTCFFLWHVCPDSASFEAPLFWLGRHLAALGGLVALARVIEVETGELFIKFFLRLNLTFVVLAGLIIVTVTRLQRREFINFAQREGAELIEYLRGHVLYFHHQGEEAGQILNQSVITRKIASSFGTIPELRKVSIRFLSGLLEMTIQPDGFIDRHIVAEGPTDLAEVPRAVLGKGSLRLAAPIFLDGNLAGFVAFEESSATMNRRIAHRILIILASFTAVVVFGSFLIGFIVTQADNTIQRQYRQLERSHRKLLQAAKLTAVGEMAEGVAHEINNPLGVILGRADYLCALARMKDGDEFMEDLNVIQDNAQRASRIIAELLAFGRPQPLDPQPRQVNELVEETLRQMAPRMGQVRVQQCLQPVPLVQMDRDRLQQVLVNLVNNAVEACRGGGEIRICTGMDSSRRNVFISVEDDGAGMAEETLRKIFDPFFTTKKKGTGLGLSLSSRIIADHGGEIRASSSPGRGSRFTVSLPAA